MNSKKSKSIKHIEQKMGKLSPDSLRYQVLVRAKEFKTSWIELGQILYTVWKNKLYKEWGYIEFETYTSKEIGIQKQTALKLLRSYAFLQKEGPRYLKKDYTEEASVAQVPTYEAVDVLRRASGNKELGKEDYAQIKKYVLEDGKNAREAQKHFTMMIKKNEEMNPKDLRKKSTTQVKRFLSLLKSIRQEIRTSDILSKKVVDETDKLINMLEMEMPQDG